MGLGAANLFDPSLGEQSSALGKLYGDLAIVIFLLMDGHHTIIIAASGLGNGLPPGVFSPSTDLVMQMSTATGLIFKLGILIASPIVATLLITQFVLGILSRTIPSINVFFLSFPITVGLGLTLASLSLPSFLVVVQRAIVDTSYLFTLLF
jgi:flagellar biosynthetic protein FliR